MAMLRRWMAFPLSRLGLGVGYRPGSSGGGGSSGGQLDFGSAANSAHLLTAALL